MKEIKVNLDLNNPEKTIKVYCKKITGAINIIYIDEETGEEIKNYSAEGLRLGEQLINIIDVDGYEIIDIKEEVKEEIVEEEKEEIEKEFDIKDFCKSLSIKLGDDE